MGCAYLGLCRAELPISPPLHRAVVVDSLWWSLGINLVEANTSKWINFLRQRWPFTCLSTNRTASLHDTRWIMKAKALPLGLSWVRRRLVPHGRRAMMRSHDDSVRHGVIFDRGSQSRLHSFRNRRICWSSRYVSPRKFKALLLAF